MVEEIDTKKVKKGFICTIATIPISSTLTLPLFDFTPKTITKISLVVVLTAGINFTVEVQGVYTFPVAGDLLFGIYSNTFAENGIADFVGYGFNKYKLYITTNATTTGRIYIFFEYDYDLIK